MQIIISLSLILFYVHYFHHNSKNCHQDTRSCVIVNVVYIPKVYIHHYYHDVIGILKNSKIKSKILKREGLGEKQIA